MSFGQWQGEPIVQVNLQEFQPEDLSPPGSPDPLYESWDSDRLRVKKEQKNFNEYNHFSQKEWSWDRLIKECTKLQKTNYDLELRNLVMQEQLFRSRADNVRELMKEYYTDKALIKELNEEREKQNKLVKDAQEEISKLKERLKKPCIMQHGMSEEEHHRYNLALKEEKALRKELSVLKERFNSRNNELQASQEESQRLCNAYNTLQSEFNEYKKESENRVNDIHSLNMKIENDFAQLKEQHADIINSMPATEDEVLALREMRDNAVEEWERCRQKLTEVQRQLSAQEKWIAKVQIEREQMENSRVHSCSDHTLTPETGSQEGSTLGPRDTDIEHYPHCRFRKNCELYKDQIAELNMQVIQYKLSYIKAENQIRELDSEIYAVRQKLAEAENISHILSGHMKELEEELENNERGNSESERSFRKEILRLEEELSVAMTNLYSKNPSIADMVTELQYLRSQAEDNISRSKSLKSQVAQEAINRMTAESKSKAMERELHDKYMDSIFMLEQDLENKDTEIVRLRRKLATFNSAQSSPSSPRDSLHYRRSLHDMKLAYSPPRDSLQYRKSFHDIKRSFTAPNYSKAHTDYEPQKSVLGDANFVREPASFLERVSRRYEDLRDTTNHMRI
ncbi:hypothetical protein K7432_003312 [Basidiobolus ranarum]|uniref:Uncharacterized protein n=1 Tax=Basidiobolus ranarum TaxID=34480 RepID=A0ABR2X015_9FUNG